MGGWSRLKKAVVISIVGVVGLGGIGALAGPGKTPVSPPPSPPPKVQPLVSKIETSTEAIPFDTQNVDDATLASGTVQTKTEGVNGVKTKTWNVTYTDGKETKRDFVKEEVTKAPVAKVVLHGTKVAVNCPNGTYVNSDGNVVCRPYPSPDGPPAGATARCVDGTYSFSQHRSGTCSHHGGVAQWLY